MNKPNHSATRRIPAWIAVPVLGFGLVLLDGCTATQKAPVAQASSFFGADRAKLSVGGEEQASLRYVNPAAQWTQYKKVLVAPVAFWGGEATKVPAADQQALVNYFAQQLKEALGKKFQLVDQPGPGVLKVEVALVDAEAATPVLRSVSMIIPQAHMISNLKYLATGTFPFVGAAQAAAKISDAASGELLAAAEDKRLGGGSFTTGFQWQWGDAENAITGWSKQLADKLSAQTSGAGKP